MKVKVKEIVFTKSLTSKYGQLHNFKMVVVDPDGNQITGFYSTNDYGFNAESKTQKKFKEGQEADIELYEMVGKEGKKWCKIKPEQKSGYSKYNHSLRREQSKYSGFAMSYAKDLVVSDKIKIENIAEYTKMMFDLMVNLDKSIS